ncbi:cysteine proteinase [Lentinula aciculospora]|uniref:Cysteine proteinase n=1 Tax=Lentinula aciculospora TaxID=153920 RepID=A0A9W9A828_9AGAR|nr:cysteine proteinase [Lentinula aciculospora]
MNDRKRPALEQLSSVRAAKQQRTGLLSANGERQSPAVAKTAALVSRWNRIYHDLKELGKDTILLISGRVVPSESPEEFIEQQGSSQTLSPSPELLTQSGTAVTAQVESPPTTPDSAHSFAVSQSSLRPTNLYATSSYSSLPSTSHFTFTPRNHHLHYSSQSSEISFPTSSSIHRLPITPSSSSPNLYSSRRPRKKSAMGPPPDPPASTSFFRSTSVLEKNLQSLKMGQHSRHYKTRPHIYVERHKQEIKKKLEATRDELFKLAQQKRGFKSDRKDFDSYLDYSYMLEQPEKKARFTSPSMIDLRSEYASDEEKIRVRRNSESSNREQWLERKLEIAQKMLNGPRPPPVWSPSLDDLKLRQRSKDDLIEQRLRPQRPPLPSLLPSEDEIKVQALLNQPGVISKYAREQVLNQDLVRLKPGSWLNDEIINFYGALILGRSDASKENGDNGTVNGVVNVKKGKVLNVHYFTTFFWQKLTRDGYEKGRLAKWTKKVDLFSKDAVLIPVNHDNTHWTAAAINFRQKRIESYDSMFLDRSAVFKVLRGYLDAEHRNKKKAPFDFTGWQDYVVKDTPQQENGYDCGVFTCQFLESLSRGEETFNFTQDDIPYLRRRMIWEIGHSKLRTDP